MEKKITYEVKRSLTRDELFDVLATAVEGGIGYWACLDNTTLEWAKARSQVKEEMGDDYCIEDVMIQMINNGDNIKFFDAEDPDEGEDPNMCWYLNADTLSRGCALYSENRGDLVECLRNADFDADEADCLMQYALMGEIVFG